MEGLAILLLLGGQLLQTPYKQTKAGYGRPAKEGSIVSVDLTVRSPKAVLLDTQARGMIYRFVVRPNTANDPLSQMAFGAKPGALREADIPGSRLGMGTSNVHVTLAVLSVRQ